MQAATVNDNVRLVVEIVTSIFVFAGFVITLMIKNNQANVKAELIKGQTETKEDLVAAQNDMRMDMDAKHAQNAQAIAVHQASDDARFDAISRTLVRIDGKLDQINGRSH